MKKGLSVFIPIIAIVLIVGGYLVSTHNRLVKANEAVDATWAQVESQYQRRFDLTDNLVQTVKAGQKQELEVFKSIADARKQYNSALTLNERTKAISSIETNLALVPRLQEAYPELKSNQLVQSLMTDLKGTEDTIAKARDSFNTTAANYNKNIRRFPKNIFASMFGFEKIELFASVKEASKVIKVNF